MSSLLDRLGRSKDAFAALQSIMVSIGLVSAGCWAILTNQLGQVKAQIAVLERSIREQGVFDLSIEARPIGGANGRSHRLICIAVTATNKGNRNMLIRLDRQPPVIVARVHVPEGEGTLGFDAPKAAWFYAGAEPGRRLSKHVLRVDEVYRYSTVVDVDTPGLYWVGFNAEVSADDSQPVAALGAPPGPMHWGGSAFFDVQ